MAQQHYSSIFFFQCYSTLLHCIPSKRTIGRHKHFFFAQFFRSFVTVRSCQTWNRPISNLLQIHQVLKCSVATNLVQVLQLLTLKSYKTSFFPCIRRILQSFKMFWYLHSAPWWHVGAPLTAQQALGLSLQSQPQGSAGIQEFFNWGCPNWSQGYLGDTDQKKVLCCCCLTCLLAVTGLGLI